jgi:hypothetical protein
VVPDAIRDCHRQQEVSANPHNSESDHQPIRRGGTHVSARLATGNLINLSLDVD